MRPLHFSPLKLISAVAACLLFLSIAVNFLAQDTPPSPGPSVQASPSATPGASAPPRMPSPTPLPGAQNFHQWGSITVFNGLPSDTVRAIAQTPDGVMWFGTDNGLARFDGRRVQRFSLSSPDTDRIIAMKATSAGELIIGTRAGAFVYDASGFRVVEGTRRTGITSIILEPELLLGTDTGLVLSVAADSLAAPTAVSLFPDPLIAEDGSSLGITGLVRYKDELLAGTSGRGVYTIRPGTPAEYTTAPRPLFVNALAAGDSELWFGTEAAKGISGVYSIERTRRAIKIAAPTADVTSLELNDSGLWAGTERYGLFQFGEGKLKKSYTFANTSGGLRSDNIFALFTDREGVIWIGTNRGLSRFDRLGSLQQTVSDSPNGNFIRTLFRSSGGTVYAGSNRGLFMQSGDKWIPVPGYANQPVYALAEDRSHKLVVGTSERINQSIKDVRSFAEFQGSTYAAVFGLGLAQLGSGGFNVKHPDASVSALCAAGGKLWIGTEENGLFSFDGRGVTREVAPEVLKSGMIRRIIQGPDQAIWVGAEHGVFRVTHDASEKIIDAEDVRDVRVDDDGVWAATTTRGLLHARRDDRFGWLVTSIGFEQGLPSEKAFWILPLDDGLLIATNRGVVTYKAGSVPPKLIATRVLSQRMHDLAELRSKIELDYPQNSLLVEVAGQSSRTFPEEFQYAFVLKNAKGDTVDSRISTEPQYAPADLKPGDYTIETIAFNRDLLASEPLSIEFSVGKAPFPRTATALGILLAVALIALVWAIIERRRIVLRSRELAAARLDLAHEAERERSRIARDLHDQTLADLRDLMMKSDKALPPGTGFREDIEAISTEIRRICEDLSPSVLENVGFVASLEFLLSHTIENYRFNADGVDDEHINFPINVQLQIYRIVQEVLTNIKRHANAKLVEMTVSVPEPSAFQLAIINDGVPFTPPQHSAQPGRGISGIRSRSALIHAAVTWDETADGRPRFSLSLERT